MKIRRYTSSDFDAVLHLLQLNTPKYFAPSEEKDLTLYLQEEIEDYFVIDADDGVVACGGVNYPDTACLSWDIIHPSRQGRGYGTMLVEHRLAHIRKHTTHKQVIVRTSQLAHPFYQKMGFTIDHIVENYWAEGYDLYKMTMQL